MTLRHAAALALVGWYLMMPPINPSTDNERLDAPVSEWVIDSSYDSAQECQQAIHTLQRSLMPPRGASAESVRSQAAKAGQHARATDYERAIAAICIATDDPRLKEK
jgi:hypothetical protein